MENKEPVTQTEEKTEENTVTQSENKIEDNSATQNTNSEKTYTQKDMNAFEKRIKDKYKEKYKDYDAWIESRKTETEKQAEFNKKMTDTENENTTLKRENLAYKKDVNSDDVDYVVYKVSKMEGDFEENLEEFLKENPKYLRTSKNVGTSDNKTTGVQVEKIENSNESGVAAILKAKHPEAFKN